MQTNLQSITFNSRNRIKHDFINYRYDPHVNRISDDLRYKRRSITNTERNPVHINGGAEYLYNKRIEEIKRKLNTHVISVDQYNAELKRIQIARFGRPVMNDDVIVIPNVNIQQPKHEEEEEQVDETEHETEPKREEEDNRDVLEIVNNPSNATE